MLNIWFMKQKTKSLTVLCLIPVIVTAVTFGTFVSLAFALRLDRESGRAGGSCMDNRRYVDSNRFLDAVVGQEVKYLMVSPWV